MTEGRFRCVRPVDLIPPDLTITAPADGDMFRENETIPFTATTAGQPLGTGCSIHVNLPVGSYMIQADVVDSTGMIDFEFVNIHVESCTSNATISLDRFDAVDLGEVPDNGRNYDARKARRQAVRPSPEQGAAVEAMAATMPDLAVVYDEKTGGVRTLVNHTGYLSDPHPGADLAAEPRTVAAATASDLRRTTRLEAPGLARNEITAQLLWMPVSTGEVRLVWNFQVETLDDQHHYDFTVETETASW